MQRYGCVQRPRAWTVARPLIGRARVCWLIRGCLAFCSWNAVSVHDWNEFQSNCNVVSGVSVIIIMMMIIRQVLIKNVLCHKEKKMTAQQFVRTRPCFYSYILNTHTHWFDGKKIVRKFRMLFSLTHFLPRLNVWRRRWKTVEALFYFIVFCFSKATKGGWSSTKVSK